MRVVCVGVAGVADHGKIRVCSQGGQPSHHDLAITLHDHAMGDVAESRDGGRYFAVGTEGRVECPVGVVACEGEVLVLPVACFTDCDDPSGAIQRQAEGFVVGTKVRRHNAVGAERGVRAAVAVETRQPKVQPLIGIRPPGNHKLTVGLQYHIVAEVGAAQIDNGFTVAVEGGVQTAVAVVPCQGEVGTSVAGDDDLAIGLYDQILPGIGGSEVCDRDAVNVKSGIQAAVGVVTDGEKINAAAVGYRLP